MRVAEKSKLKSKPSQTQQNKTATTLQPQQPSSIRNEANFLAVEDVPVNETNLGGNGEAESEYREGGQRRNIFRYT